MQKDETQKQTEEIVQNAQEQVEQTATGNEQAEETVAAATPILDEKEQKIEELQNRILRLQADFDNFRRRTTKEQTQLASFVTANVVDKFLKVLDNFERAEASVNQTSDEASIRVGLEKIHRQFEQALKELAVEEIPAQGEIFNPELHEAVMRGQNPDLAEDAIEMVLEKGYRLHDKVIRHSKVKVISND
ncbi:MAG: nucleotide exchange factor GrpE [Acidaminococcaceae bacterium]